MVTVTNVNEPPELSGRSHINDFEENSSSRVAFYNARDPESPNNPVIWSLGGADADQFELGGSSSGRPDLYIKSAPNFEDPADQDRDNEFEVTIEASDERPRPLGLVTLQVAVDVTDRDETETLTLSSDQPVEDVLLTTTLTEPDQVTNKRWQWQRSQSQRDWGDIDREILDDYRPVSSDVGDYLRVKLTYHDPHRTDRSLTATTTRTTLESPTDNDPPTFLATETGMRSVDENSRHRTNIGIAVAARMRTTTTLSTASTTPMATGSRSTATPDNSALVQPPTSTQSRGFCIPSASLPRTPSTRRPPRVSPSLSRT